MSNAKRFILFLIVVALIVAVVLIALFAPQTEDEESETFSVTVNGTAYSSDVSGLILPKKTKIGINGADSFTAEIKAVMPEEDFSFNVGAEEWKWSELSSYDLTAGFDITVYVDSFTLDYEDLASVIRGTLGYNAEVTVGNVPWSDLFNLRVSDGDQNISVKFTIEGIFRIELDPPAIIF